MIWRGDEQRIKALEAEVARLDATLIEAAAAVRMKADEVEELRSEVDCLLAALEAEEDILQYPEIVEAIADCKRRGPK